MDVEGVNGSYIPTQPQQPPPPANQPPVTQPASTPEPPPPPPEVENLERSVDIFV